MATRVEADDRSRLERLCRYVIRPPLAAGKLRVFDEGTLSFTLKTPWSDGTMHLVLSPLELIEKLAVFVPPLCLNLVRYHSVLAPNAAGRDCIVSGPQEASTEGCSHAEQPSAPQPVYRLSWARLLARVFRVDVTECPACGGKMEIIAALTEPLAIRSYLDGVGQPSRAPPIAPPRPFLRSNSNTPTDPAPFPLNLERDREKCVPAGRAVQLAPCKQTHVAATTRIQRPASGKQAAAPSGRRETEPHPTPIPLTG